MLVANQTELYVYFGFIVHITGSKIFWKTDLWYQTAEFTVKSIQQKQIKSTTVDQEGWKWSTVKLADFEIEGTDKKSDICKFKSRKF